MAGFSRPGPGEAEPPTEQHLAADVLPTGTQLHDLLRGVGWEHEFIEVAAGPADTPMGVVPIKLYAV